MLPVPRNELFLEGGQAKKVVLFRNRFGGTSALRAWLAGLGVVDVQVIEDAILACVLAFVDKSVLLESQEQIRDHSGVRSTRGSLKAVDGKTQDFELPLEF